MMNTYRLCPLCEGVSYSVLPALLRKDPDQVYACPCGAVWGEPGTQRIWKTVYRELPKEEGEEKAKVERILVSVEDLLR